jgi:DNA-directed RNA polymerase specialized sigma24 family protein
MTDDLQRVNAAMRARRGARPRRRSTEPVAPDCEMSGVELVRAVYWSTTDLLIARGVPAIAASRIAVRVTRAMLLVGVVGSHQADTAQALGVSERQVERDLALVRELGRDVLDLAYSSPIPPPADRIVLEVAA